MAANLANIYAELMRRYGEDYTITYGPPPTYLGSIAGAGEVGKKIVLVFKEDRNAAASKIKTTPTKLLQKIEGTSELDLTGSPLKDDCIVDAIADLSLDLQLVSSHPWKLEEEFQRGMTVDKARGIICTEHFQHADGLGSVWFLCDGSDHGQTQLLQYEFNKTHFSRGILSYQGVLPAFMVTSQSLVRQHSIAGGAPMETSIENRYQVNPKMTLRCSWVTSSPQPQLVNLRECEVALSHTFRVGDCSSLTQDFMNQLRILVYIREDIVSYHNDERQGLIRDPTYRCGSGIDMDELRDSINKTMTDVSDLMDTYITGASEFDIEEVVHRAKGRRLTDLTDKLWELLKCCGSYKDLKMAFNMLFQCAARCNIVNTPTNKNRLAEIITELANRRLAIPCLSGAEALELLLEVGLEKVYKDYEFIYTESKMCSTNLLKESSETADGSPQNVPQLRKSLHNAVRGDATPGGGMRKTLLHLDADSRATAVKYGDDDVAGIKNSHFDEHESMERISKLFQIHCTMEHLLMIHIHLNLPNVYSDVCSELLKKTPKQVEAIDDQLSDVMDIHLAAHYVRDHLDGKEPYSRHITMKSVNKFRELQTTFYFNSENICPPQLAQCFQCDDKELVKERTYHSWLYRKIRTLK
ncbi:protein zwilch [Drosophila pseudoobscura]|uniref:Protein zwilch n=1 Tax=Drosophila pseudoobscura pseudoobscura TaxID=46245 RepID=A0A6I8ULR2_DROPS|nr:protein zwilch [Drosophila pseudoobscura]